MNHRNPLQNVVLVAASNSEQARSLGQCSETTILSHCINDLFEQTNLSHRDIDGLNVYTARTALKPREAAQMFGPQPRWVGNEFMGIAALIEAASAIACGQASAVVIGSAQCGEYSQRSATAPWTRPQHEFTESYGLYTAVEFALCAQRHMHLYGTPQEALATVAANIRSNGNLHPQACFYGRGPVSAQDVLDSRMVATPFHLLDCCITSEGAAALMLMHADKAQALGLAGVRILGAATDRMGMAYTRAPVWDNYGHVGQRAGRIAFQQAGLTPDDIDVLELYDPFSFEVIRQLEVLGFCPLGEGGNFVLDGHTALGGSHPVSSNGGLLAFSHAGTVQMLQKVIAAYEQLRGLAPIDLRVANAETAIATNGGAGALFCDVLLLGSEVVS